MYDTEDLAVVLYKLGFSAVYGTEKLGCGSVNSFRWRCLFIFILLWAFYQRGMMPGCEAGKDGDVPDNVAWDRILIMIS
jgi:hypothetical protein